MVATVVVLLIISGIVASATYQTSGAVEQANAAKISSEIADIAKGANLYKMTSRTYAGISVDELKNLGIAPVLKNTGTNGGYVYADGSAVADNTDFIESKVNPNIGYVVESANGGDNYKIRVIAKTAAMKSSEKYAIEKAIANVYEGADKGTDASDGAVDIVM